MGETDQRAAEKAAEKAEELTAEAERRGWRYFIHRFEGGAMTYGEQPPGDALLLNAIAARGWRLIAATSNGLYFERESS